MKSTLLLVLAFLVSSCAHVSVPNTPERLNKYAKSTVIVRVQTVATNIITGQSEVIGWSGTGFSVENDPEDAGSTVLTNKHVCSAGPEASYTLTDATGKKFRATYVRVAPHADLCLLHTDAIITPVKLAKSDAKKGDHVTVVGAPRGVFPNFTEGYVSGYCPIDIVDSGFEVHLRAECTSVPIYPGNSGSPAFNDDGEVVGIMFAGRRDSEHMTIMVPVELIKQFMDTSNDMYTR